MPLPAWFHQFMENVALPSFENIWRCCAIWLDLIARVSLVVGVYVVHKEIQSVPSGIVVGISTIAAALYTAKDIGHLYAAFPQAWPHWIKFAVPMLSAGVLTFWSISLGKLAGEITYNLQHKDDKPAAVATVTPALPGFEIPND